MRQSRFANGDLFFVGIQPCERPAQISLRIPSLQSVDLSFQNCLDISQQSFPIVAERLVLLEADREFQRVRLDSNER